MSQDGFEHALPGGGASPQPWGIKVVTIKGAVYDYKLALYGLETTPQPDGIVAVIIKTSQGDIECRLYPCPGAEGAVVFVGGVSGGWGSPGDLYSRLAEDLVGEGISSLRVKFRRPNAMEVSESALDVLAGLAVLEQMGLRRVALVGISFGGAVVIQAAVFSPDLAKGVVAMSTQRVGAGRVNEISPRPLLLVHGIADPIIPYEASEWLYERAGEPKELVLYEGAGHGLRECADQLYDLLRARLVEWVGPRVG